MLLKRIPRNAKPDSISTNPEAKKLLTKLIATGTISNNAKAADWYYRKPYATVFKSVDLDKFRPYFKRLLNQKYHSASASSGKFSLNIALIITDVFISATA